MRYYDNGAFFSVSVSQKEMVSFACKWPGFGSVRPITFQFQKSNGDLVDCSRSTESNDWRGIDALMEDAREYGFTKTER